MFSRTCVLCAIFVVLMSVIVSFLQLFDGGTEKPELLLGVCVLSAQDHLEQRSAIRNTWFIDDDDSKSSRDKEERSNRTVARFVVGKEGCSVHPVDRVDQYGCQEWTPNVLPEMDKDFEAFTTGEKSRTGPKVNRLSIRVMHPVILKRIGVFADVALSEEPLVVSVFQDFEEEELRSVQFSAKDPGIIHQGFHYQPVEPVELQKGTQLEISLNSSNDDITVPNVTMSSPYGSTTIQHNIYQQAGPAVLLVQGMGDDGTVLKDHNSSLFSMLSFMYTVQDVEGLQQHSRQRQQRQQQWQEKLQADAEALKAEVEGYGDILLVDGVDTYRSLPAKLLQCHDWFSQKFVAHHVMKTDDDTYVDLRTVADILRHQPLAGLQWWGNFRKEWLVERVGKWREEDYAPSVYPPFACGSGSVVSRELHVWLAHNQHVLHSFQGEDISVGIWLAPLAPTLLQDRRWQCVSLCDDSLLSMPDLTSQQLQTHWYQHLHCTSPCSSC